MSDFFKTVKGLSQAKYTEKMSRFLAYVEPVQSADEAKAVVKRYANDYHDARHVCWAYMIGTERNEYPSSDNGEPSGTAGKPILGQINSFGLTNVVIVVVRYFGGIKLGTSGLIQAYRAAAAEAIAAATIVERTIDRTLHIQFDYLLMNDVMRILKELGLTPRNQQFGLDCRLDVPVRQSQSVRAYDSLAKLYGLKIDIAENN